MAKKGKAQTGAPATEAAAAAPAEAPIVDMTNDARIQRLENQVAALHALLHHHGIRHKE